MPDQDLTQKRCIPCEGGIPPLTDEQEDALITQVEGWELDRTDTHAISKKFKFDDFKKAMTFVNNVAEIAESEGHHPDIFIHYNKVTLTHHTYAIRGLHDNDFILAAKVDKMVADQF